MSLAEDYRRAVAALVAEQPSPELLPWALVRACVRVLPIDGAGVSATESLRVPLAASDPVMVRAEQLQTTLGEGPCLSAAAAQRTLLANMDRMKQRWPVFFARLVAATPYRSVMSVPLQVAGEPPFGALDLYSTDPTGGGFPALDEIDAAIGAPTAALLMDAPRRVSHAGVEMPVWLDNDAANDRMDVWVAVGILMASAGLGNDDALAALRRYARHHALSLDEVAHRLLIHELGSTQIRYLSA